VLRGWSAERYCGQVLDTIRRALLANP
jgi:hypothetical protein